MQDRLGDLGKVLSHVAPGNVGYLRAGPSAIFDAQLLRGDHFDVEAHLGINRHGQHENQFMRDALTEIDRLKKGIAEVEESLDKIQRLNRRIVEATSPEAEKQCSDELNRVMDETNRIVMSVKAGIDSLRAENVAFAAKNPNSSEARMRDNLHAAVSRKFRGVLKRYQTVQVDYKKSVREKVSRQVKIVFPEASDEELAHLADDGDAAAAAIQARLGGQAHEVLANALNEIQDKYNDIKKLEKSVVELHQMFVDLATLVDAQGDLLDQIEFSVNNAKDYTERAEKELINTRKNQRRAKKRMCWLTSCIVVVAIVIMLPVIVMLTR